ncbi:MAG TPA: uroporphyrinogen-III synthase [Candidatus Binatia bacterium]|jgi:uroporphyrinogen III methyltransferase/synthase
MEARQQISSSRSLSGRRIVVTRARAQASAFTRALEALGADAIEFPTIEIAPPESYRSLDDAISNIKRYDWIIFTSVNGVDHFSGRVKLLKRDLNVQLRAAAIGPETAKAAEALGLRPEVVPEEFRAEAILGKLKPGEMRGRRVLVPRAAEARDVLIRTLRDWGAEVDVVEAYRTIPPKTNPAPLRARLLSGEIDMVTFTSSSTVKNFRAIFGAADLRELLARTVVACIGPITQQTATESGMRVDLVAKDYTIAGLTDAIVEYFKRATGKRQ